MNKKEMIRKINRLEEIIQSQCDHELEYVGRAFTYLYNRASYEFKCSKCDYTAYVEYWNGEKVVKEIEIKKAKKILEKHGYEIKE